MEYTAKEFDDSEEKVKYDLSSTVMDLDQWFPEFTGGAREQIYFEVGLGDKTITIII